MILVVLAWVAIGLMSAILVTQLVGWSGTSQVVSLQALTPYTLVLSVPIAVAAGVTGRWWLAAAAAAVAVTLAVMCWPLLARPGQQRSPDDARPLRIFHGNLLYSNSRISEVARVIADLDADVLAFTEYTPAHAAGLDLSSLSRMFAFRLERPEPRAGGSAIWSRYRIDEIAAPPALYQSIAAIIDVAGGLTMYVVHPPNPLEDLEHWRTELDSLVRLRAAVEPPAIVIGDFNASYWHPPFRRLRAAGWRDAHELGGRGLSGSWPTDRAWLPPILRLDHALVDDSQVVTGVVDVDLPGSDHRGFIVTVAVGSTALARRAGRSRRPRGAMDGSSTASSPRREPSARTTSPGSAAGAPSPPPDR